MQSRLSRRNFLRTASTLSAVALIRAHAEETLPRTSEARLKLSLAAYSFRDFFKNEVAEGKRMDMFKFIDYCAEHHCDAAELTSYYFPKDADRSYLLKLKRHAFLRGIEISGSAIGNTYTHPPGPDRDKELALTRQWISNCATLGAPHLRVFAGAVQKGDGPEKAVANCIETLRIACADAARQGIFLGIENHGGIVAEPGPLLEIIKAVNSPWLGINLDTGNFHTDDPYADFAKCAPYAVNVQVKTEVHPKGGKIARADLKRYLQILREAKYQGYVALEFEEKADPFDSVPPVLEELDKLIHT